VGAEAYQQRFDTLAAAGRDVHGEADLVARLVTPPSRVLDAGCGTGRVSAELTRRGFRCVGVDVDADMVAVARKRDHDSTYVVQDLSRLDLTETFDLVVLAGNVVALLAPGTLSATMRRIADHVVPLGLVVAGFGLDAEHLPPGCRVTSVDAYDRACAAAGLHPVRRYATWERERWSAGAGYVVAVHSRD
jgi:SAM-dependent methyltransferase